MLKNGCHLQESTSFVDSSWWTGVIGASIPNGELLLNGIFWGTTMFSNDPGMSMTTWENCYYNGNDSNNGDGGSNHELLTIVIMFNYQWPRDFNDLGNQWSINDPGIIFFIFDIIDIHFWGTILIISIYQLGQDICNIHSTILSTFINHDSPGCYFFSWEDFFIHAPQRRWKPLALLIIISLTRLHFGKLSWVENPP